MSKFFLGKWRAVSCALLAAVMLASGAQGATNTVLGKTSNYFDSNTGKFIGIIDYSGREQQVPSYDLLNGKNVGGVPLDYIGSTTNLAPRASFINKPAMIPAPLYSTLTANQVVYVGQAITSNSNTYYAAVSGAIGTGTPPTTASVLPIVDGSAVWIYDGPAPVAVANPPTIVVSATNPSPATLPRFYRPSGATTDVSSTSNVTNDTWYTVAGGTMLHDANGLVWNVAGNNVGPFEITFNTAAPKFCFVFPTGALGVLQIFIDDQLVGPGIYGKTADGNFSFITVTMGVPNRVSHKITALGPYTAHILGVLVAASDTIENAPVDLTNSMATEGDSITGGSNYGWFLFTDHPVYRAAKYQGFSNWFTNTQGGSGYLLPAADTTTFRGRISRIPPLQREIAVFGGLDDIAGSTPAQVGTEVGLYLPALRAAQPIAHIDIFGVYAASRGPDAPVLAMEAAIQTAVALYVAKTGDKMVQFQALSTASTPWDSGTGTASSTNGSGNTDWTIFGTNTFGGLASDTTHPDPNGTRHHDDRWSQTVMPALGPFRP